MMEPRTVLIIRARHIEGNVACVSDDIEIDVGDAGDDPLVDCEQTLLKAADRAISQCRRDAKRRLALQRKELGR